jgi:hypothetical protein
MSFPPSLGSFKIDFHGLDIVRARDCVLFGKGDSHVVTVDETMIRGGWAGGQGVMWVDSPLPEPVVSYSNGLYGGFMLWGSDESADQYVSTTRAQLVHPQSAVMMAGNAILSTSSYERYTYASRIGGGSLVSLVYAPKDPLYFSRRGLWTKEDESSQGVALPFAPAFFVGFVLQAPSSVNQFFLGIQASL